MFANALPEKLLGKMGRIHLPRPITIQSRQELLGGTRLQHWKHLRGG